MKALPPHDYLHRVFSYDKLTGILSWKRRPHEHFAHPKIATVWNRDWAGREAGYVYSKRGYRRVRIAGTDYQVHRIIWKLVTGHDPDCIIDHADRDPSNNRWKNLRAATYGQNNSNMESSGSSTGYRGVSKNGKKFVGKVCHKGKHYGTGSFPTAEAAAQARCKLVDKLHGSFAYK